MRLLVAGCWECIHPTPASALPNHGRNCEGAIAGCWLSTCWQSLPAGQVCVLLKCCQGTAVSVYPLSWFTEGRETCHPWAHPTNERLGCVW
jgi:hypothetical protein